MFNNTVEHTEVFRIWFHNAYYKEKYFIAQGLNFKNKIILNCTKIIAATFYDDQLTLRKHRPSSELSSFSASHEIAQNLNKKTES